MGVSKKARQSPQLKAELDVRRFFWRLTRQWLGVKNDPTKISGFWTQHERTLQEFDKEYPNHHRPALPQHPVLPPALMGIMLAKGATSMFEPHPTPTMPGPAQRRQKTPPPAPLKFPSKSRSPTPTYVNRFQPLAEDAGHSQNFPAAIPTQDAGHYHQWPGSSGDFFHFDAGAPPSFQNAGFHDAGLYPTPDPYRTAPDNNVYHPMPGAVQYHPTPVTGPYHIALDAGTYHAVPDAGLTSNMPDAEGDEDAEGSEEETPAPTTKDKGKQREVNRDDEAIKVMHPASEVDKKRVPPQGSGRFRKPACKRCGSKKKCEDQIGYASACVNCAKLKMRCEPQSEEASGGEDDSATAPTNVTKKIPALPPRPALPSKPAPPTNTSPGKIKKCPAPLPPRRPAQATSQQKAPARAPALETAPIDLPASTLPPAPPMNIPAPTLDSLTPQTQSPRPAIPDHSAPEPSKPPAKKRAPKRKTAPAESKKRKIIKTTENVDSSDDDSGDRRWKPKAIPFEKFENYFGTFLYLISEISYKFYYQMFAFKWQSRKSNGIKVFTRISQKQWRRICTMRRSMRR